MTLRVNSNNIQSDVLATISGPRMGNVQITDSSYTVLDDTAVDVAGGYIKITGSNFVSGCQVLIDVTAATTVTFVSSTEVRAQVPAKTAGTYTVYLVNPNGDTAIRVNGLTYSAFPAWSTGSTLPNGAADAVISIQLSAPSNSTVSYALAAGNTLPTGLTLSNVGLLSGTVTGLTVETTYNFTVIATDLEYQDTSRAFSITLTVGDTNWRYVSTLLGPSLSTLPFTRDASSNNHNVSIVADARPSNLSPFTNGYSVVFNGSTDYLTVSNTAQFLPGSGDFTVEAWIYVTSTTNTAGTVVGVWKAATGQAWQILANGNIVTLRLNGTLSVDTASGSAPVNQWNHIAWVKSGSTNTIYINGVSSATLSASTINSSTDPLAIGFNLDNAPSVWYYQGHISNLRIVKGTALYTANFTPSTQSLSSVAGTSLLTCKSNSAFIDQSANSFAITRNGTPTISPFYPISNPIGASTYFDGTGDSLSIASTTALTLSGDFTVEAWVWLDSNNITYPYVFASGVFYIRFGDSGFGYKFSGAINDTGVSTVYSSAITQTDIFKRWTHVAFTRQSGVNRLFVNGTLQSLNTGANPGSYPLTSWSDSTTVGGSTWQIGTAWNGYISNFRVIKGTALYTSNFTVPTSPLTAITNTSLLTCQSNQPVTNNTFLDNSTNNFAITRAGNTTQGTFSPYGENWSNYFDGTGDYLSFSAVTSPTTGDFTVEFWFYNTRSAWTTAFDVTDGSSGSMALYFGSGGDLRIAPQAQSSTSIASVSSLPLNTWIHFAVIRSSGSLRAYANGTALAAAISYTTSLTGFTKLFGTSDGYALGYVSNFRYTTNAVYSIAGSTISVPTSPLQPIAGTRLLTCQSPSLVDNSPSNLAITKNGDVSVQKFGPFAGTTLPTPYYSGYFDGTGDYLNYTGGTTTTLSGDYTFEAWIYLNNLSAIQPIFCIGDDFSLGILFSINTSGKVYVYGNGSAILTGTGTSVTSASWTHIAVVRSGSTVTAYVNGVSQGTSTNSSTYSGTTTTIGREVYNAAVGVQYSGYISNLRLVKGQAIYTSAFTPSTSPLTTTSQGATAGNVSLLTCQSNTFVDNSTNNFTITANGDSKPKTFNPFTVTYSTKQSYTPAVFGGSMYFDGTGDYVTVSTLTAAALGGANWTIECWFYASATKTFAQIIGNRSSASGTTGYVPIAVSYESATIKLYSSSNGSSWNLVNAGTIGTVTLQSWNHVAVVRNGNNLEAYLNGIKVTLSTALSGVSYTATNLFYASGAVDPFAGYISDARLVIGTALYTSNFVPENRPLQAVRNTTLLLSGTSTGIYDSSMNNIFETVGDVKLSTTTVKFSGTTSMYFDGTGDWLHTAPGINFEFGGGDFTVEFWFYTSSTSRQWFIHAATDYWFGIDYNSTGTNKLGLWASSNGTSWNLINADAGGNGICATTLPQSQWNHIAATRSGNVWRVFLNGTQDLSVTVSGSIVDRSSQIKVIGSWAASSHQYPVNGYMSDFRVTKGIARYTANFTAPTEPFSTK